MAAQFFAGDELRAAHRGRWMTDWKAPQFPPTRVTMKRSQVWTSATFQSSDHGAQSMTALQLHGLGFHVRSSPPTTRESENRVLAVKWLTSY
eukprot:428860-Rhodomonas_salina.3